MVTKEWIQMSEKRQWDESRSPQWRYLLSKDSKAKRERQKREERMERAEGELKKGVSKRKMRKTQEGYQENRKLKNKSGKKILYSASPGGEKSRYENTEFVKSHKKDTHLTFNNNNNETIPST